MGAQAAVLLILAGVLLYRALADDVESITTALTESFVVLVFAVAVGALALGLRRGKGMARTPTLVWNALLLPVAFSMISGGLLAVGLVLLLFAAVTLVATILVPRVHDEDDRAF